MAADVDYTAVRLQLAELQARFQEEEDRLELFLSDGTTGPCLLQDDALEQSQQLQQHIASLSDLLASADDQQFALDSIAVEEAQQAASLQLATALEAQEQWDARVLRPHDAALARAIAGCSAREWEERGLLLENPLDLSAKPQLQAKAPTKTSLVQPAGYAFPGGSSSNTTTTTSTSSSSNTACASSHNEHGCSSGQQGRLQCGICFDPFPEDSMVSARLPAAAASSSTAAGRCSHRYCQGCMAQYITCELQAHKYPLLCPYPECGEELAAADVSRLLEDQPPMMQLCQAMEAEHLIEAEQRVYCPYKDCSTLLERPEQAAEGQEAPFECPVCHRSSCLICGIAGWHTGITCREFQALPADLQSAEDAAMLHMVRERKWKHCPSCRHVVERSTGCNHMKCRCGCHFCYACGVKYVSTKPSATNQDGTQGCTCDLFHVPEDAEQRPAAPAVVLHQAPQQPRPWRNGRKVSCTRCHHADSIFECPQGPDRCWFWHDEDDI